MADTLTLTRRGPDGDFSIDPHGQLKPQAKVPQLDNMNKNFKTLQKYGRCF